MTAKVDFRKSLDAYKASEGRFEIVEVPALQYLMVAYKLKSASRRDLGRDYVVPPLEGLWWADDMDVFTTSRDKSRWDWTLLLMVPDWLDEAEVLARMHDEFIPGEGLRPAGTHHEIYLSDFRKVPPDKRRTILHQPVTDR